MVAVDLLSISTATAACFALLTSNLMNMYQTISLVSSNKKNFNSGMIHEPTIEEIPDLNTDDTIKYMKKLSRKELITLFLTLDAPSIEKVHGDWNGCLLDNNNWIMTKTSNFFTHSLFAKRIKGKKSIIPRKEKILWNGKSFGDNLVGINRFFIIDKSSSINNYEQREENKEYYQNHKFDYKISPSPFFKGNKSLELIYKNHQANPLSLWKSMKDELRVVKAIRDEKLAKTTILLLGMGSMKWSGGMYNAAPFCLWKSIEDD